jgi:ABC-2 type transport system ATP-binding protein
MNTQTGDTPPPAIELTDLCVSYGTQTVLTQLSLAVPRGSIYALLGGNGSGKSTLLAVLLGLVRPTAGKARLWDHDPVSDADASRRHCAHLSENVALYPHLNALENLAYFLSLAGQRTSNAALQESLTAVDLAPEAWTRRLSGYSKGMRQKVAIALALQRNVPVLLLDEPTSGLDPGACDDFHRLLQRLRARGRTTLMVTHDLLGAASVADRVGLLSHGQITRELDVSAGQRLDLRELQQQLGYRTAA